MWLQEAGLLQDLPGPFLFVLLWTETLGPLGTEAQSEALPQAQAELIGAEPGTGQTVPDGLH